MRFFILILMTSFFIVSFNIDAKRNCDSHIRLDKYDLQRVFSVNPPNLMEYLLNDSITLSIYFYSCKGDLYIKEYDKRLRIRFEGAYRKAKGIKKTYNFPNEIDPSKFDKKRVWVYSPARSGIWKYYDSLGVVIKEEYYPGP